MTLFSKNFWLKTNQLVFTKNNIQLLGTDIFKSNTGVLPELMNDIFKFLERPYNLRSNYTLERKQDHTVYHDPESFSALAPKL